MMVDPLSLLPQIRVLITAFRPFTGRRVNGSATLIKTLQAPAANIILQTIELEVRWGVIEDRVLPILKEWQPTCVIGLGEGHPDRVAVESLGQNYRSGQDEQGKLPRTPEIMPQGPQTLESNLEVPLELFGSAGLPVVTSTHAGHYLCNNALYLYAYASPARHGFIHLPPQLDMSDQNYINLLRPIVAKIIDHNLLDLKSLPERSILGEVSRLRLQPRSLYPA